MRSWPALLALLLLAGPAQPAASPPAEQWVVVVAPAHRKAVEPLVEQRRGQGLRVVLVPTTDVLSGRDLLLGDARPLRAKIAALCRAHAGRTSVLLVGAVDGPHLDRVVPPLRGTLARMLGEPTDVPFGCLDGKRLPTVAVGRLPARSEDEARAMVRKTLAFENARDPGAWKRQLTILAGVPAFNPVVDRLVESMAFSRFDRINPVWSGRAVYTNPTSRFCLPDKQLRSRSLELLGNGQAITLYLGHSDEAGLYGGEAAFLDRGDFGRVKMPHGGGVFITLGCLGCRLRGRAGEGYGVAAVRNPGGPAAVIGSHGICFAAMAQLAAEGIFERALVGRLPPRLGDCWLAALEGVAKGRMDFITYRMLDAVDGDPKVPQETQRQEHLEMFVLLGDPALRLPQVENDIDVAMPAAVRPGTTLEVRGTLPARLRGAAVEVRLERTPASVPDGLEAVSARDRDRALLANFARANRFELAREAVATLGTSFTARLKVPESLPWSRVIVRVRAATATDEAVVARTVPVTADGGGR